jgi:hypothetical protein
MLKSPTLTAIVLLFLAVGIGIFVLSQRNNKQPQTTSQTPKITSRPANQKSLKELLASTTPQQCAFKDSGENQGTTYIAEGKVRGDFTTTIGQEVSISHMILLDKMAYLWMENQKSGYKMPFDVQAEGSLSAQSSVDLDKKLDYSCSEWKADTSKFTLPAGITFGDIGKILPATHEEQCAACEKAVPESAKNECKTILKCN